MMPKLRPDDRATTNGMRHEKNRGLVFTTTAVFFCPKDRRDHKTQVSVYPKLAQKLGPVAVAL